MGLSVHDALTDWQAGTITTRRAMSLTGADDVIELYALAESCNVEVRTELLGAEVSSVDRAIKAIDRAMAMEETAGMSRGVA